MTAYYDHRNIKSTPISTIFVVSENHLIRHAAFMFSKTRFLAEVLAVAGSKAEMARTLKLPTPRIAEIFNGTRKLSIEEGMALAERFNVSPFPKVNAAQLAPILEVCLRSHPKAGWTDTEVQRLAEEIEYGLMLLHSASPSVPSQDAIDLVVRVVADRLRDKPA